MAAANSVQHLSMKEVSEKLSELEDRVAKLEAVPPKAVPTHKREVTRPGVKPGDTISFLWKGVITRGKVEQVKHFGWLTVQTTQYGVISVRSEGIVAQAAQAVPRPEGAQLPPAEVRHAEEGEEIQ